MRKKLVITRYDERAPKQSQVMPQGSAVALCPRAKELQASIQSEPQQRDAYIELASELAKQMLFRESAEVLSTCLLRWPFDWEAYYLRGRRHLSIMNYGQSAADLEMSARLLPDHWGIEYHRGIIHFIRGDFEKSARAFSNSLSLSKDGESEISVANWYWFVLTRLGKKADADRLAAGVQQDIDYGENYSYYKCMMLYRGMLTVEEALKVDEDDIPDVTLAVNAYGVANYLLAKGKKQEARHYLQMVVDAVEHTMWSAFAYHAAMADLKRIEF